MAEEELDRALAQLDEDSPQWRALMQICTVAAGRAAADTMHPAHTERTAGMAAGKLEGVLELRSELKARRARPLR